MNYQSALLWLTFALYWCGAACMEGQKLKSDDSVYNAEIRENLKSTYGGSSESITQEINENGHTSSDEYTCLANTCTDKHGLEAIKELHQQLDDDANGDIDLSETRDFLRKDLKIDSGLEKRQKAFHQNDDMHISVRELWENWLQSEVYKWTNEQVVEWLITNVKLAQYTPNFIGHNVVGSALPRLAVNNMNYLNNLGIKDPIHKQKISLKAMDVVLFGPPVKDRHSYWKDFVLIILVIVGGAGFWYGYQQNKKYKLHINSMCNDMEGLHSTQQSLETLQKELESSRQTEKNVTSEKEHLEKMLERDEADSITLRKSLLDGELSELKEENETLRCMLRIAEGKLQDSCWTPPRGLQRLLQVSYEIENRTYMRRKLTAKKQLQHVKEMCEKLRKQGSGIIGAFIFIHGKSIDEVNKAKAEAKTFLNEVTQELQECDLRWRQIQDLCKFSIIQNEELKSLDNSVLGEHNGRETGLFRRPLGNQDDHDDGISSVSSGSTEKNRYFHKDVHRYN